MWSLSCHCSSHGSFRQKLRSRSLSTLERSRITERSLGRTRLDCSARATQPEGARAPSRCLRHSQASPGLSLCLCFPSARCVPVSLSLELEIVNVINVKPTQSSGNSESKSPIFHTFTVRRRKLRHALPQCEGGLRRARGGGSRALRGEWRPRQPSSRVRGQRSPRPRCRGE